VIFIALVALGAGLAATTRRLRARRVMA
jgi:hypothetical protein